MPIESKSVWENCAKVLAEKSDEKLRIYYIDSDEMAEGSELARGLCDL